MISSSTVPTAPKPKSTDKGKGDGSLLVAYVSAGVSVAVVVLITAAVIAVSLCLCWRKRKNKHIIAADNVAYHTNRNDTEINVNAAYGVTADVIQKVELNANAAYGVTADLIQNDIQAYAYITVPGTAEAMSISQNEAYNFVARDNIAMCGNQAYGVVHR